MLPQQHGGQQQGGDEQLPHDSVGAAQQLWRFNAALGYFATVAQSVPCKMAFIATTRNTLNDACCRGFKSNAGIVPVWLGARYHYMLHTSLAPLKLKFGLRCRTASVAIYCTSAAGCFEQPLKQQVCASGWGKSI
eukprot:GHRQ01006155.1.p1 GENE.GHRQ01006155.1~~GHRQ01006155.1.p1  ORF type:complete len:135 (+),score=24.03 GHRQ01006155.1:1314-1718(+)